MITVHWQHANGDSWSEHFTSMIKAMILYNAVRDGAAECNYVLVELTSDDKVLAHWEIGEGT